MKGKMKKWSKLTEAEKQERGQQILRQCTREVKQSLAKFGLVLRKNTSVKLRPQLESRIKK